MSKAVTPKEALQRWAEKNSIGPVELSQSTGWTYMYAWNLLRGEAQPALATLGQLVMTYGAESVQEITEAFQAAMEQEPVKKKTGPLNRRGG